MFTQIQFGDDVELGILKKLANLNILKNFVI